MSVVFEYISRNYLRPIEHTALRVPVFGRICSAALFHFTKSFPLRSFLLFRQKWFLLVCVFENEVLRTENRRLKIPLHNRAWLRKTVETKYHGFEFENEREWKLLSNIRKAVGPDNSEVVANRLGSFDIHLTDSILALSDRAYRIGSKSSHKREFRLEIATFSHLGLMADPEDWLNSIAGKYLYPYFKLKYGTFFLNLKYPLCSLHRDLSTIWETSESGTLNMEIGLALDGIEAILPEGSLKAN